MNEQWRDDIRDTAHLLDAVAKGDRTRVVKLLADYLLADKGDDNDSANIGTGTIEQDVSSDFQQYQGDGGNTQLPSRRVRVVDVYGNEVDEEQRSEDGGIGPYDGEEDGFSGSQGHMDDVNEGHGTNHEYQSYNDEEESTWHATYLTNYSEQRPAQNEVNDDDIYADFDHTQEYDNPYTDHEAYDPHVNYRTTVDDYPYVYQLDDHAQDSQLYPNQNSYVHDHASQHYLSDMEEYDPDHYGYCEDDPSTYYASGALANTGK